MDGRLRHDDDTSEEKECLLRKERGGFCGPSYRYDGYSLKRILTYTTLAGITVLNTANR